MIIKQTIPALADSLVGSLENKVNELSSVIAELNQSYQDQIDNINSEHQLEVDNLNDTINDLNTTITNKDSEISELKAKELNWSGLGYSSTPQYIIDDINYSLNISEDTIYSDLTNSGLVYIPNLDYSKFNSSIRMPKTAVYADVIDLRNIKNVSYANNLFYNCSKLEQVNTVYVDGIECGSLFYNTALRSVKIVGKPYRLTTYMFEFTPITELPDIDLSDVINCERMFGNCQKLTGDLKPTYSLDKCTNCRIMFSSTYATSINLSGMYIPLVKEADYLLYNNVYLTSVTLPSFGSSAVNIEYLLGGCNKLEEVDLSPLEGKTFQSFNYVFRNCTKLKKVNLPNVTLKQYIGLPFQYCTNLEVITGIYFDANVNSGTYGSMFYKCDNLRVLEMKNLGAYAIVTNLYLNEGYIGVNNEDYPDARDYLIDSLITNSFDRAAAGYSVATIKLLQHTLDVLTDEEIAQITNKGFTLSL